MEGVVAIHFKSRMNSIANVYHMWYVNIIIYTLLSEFYDFLVRPVIAFCTLCFRINISNKHFILMSPFRGTHPYNISYGETLKSVLLCQSRFLRRCAGSSCATLNALIILISSWFVRIEIKTHNY